MKSVWFFFIKMKRITEKLSVVPKTGVENHNGKINRGVMFHPPHPPFCLSAVPYCLTTFHYSEQSQAHTQPGVRTALSDTKQQQNFQEHIYGCT